LKKKATDSLRKYYAEHPEAKGYRRQLIYERERFFINSGRLKFPNSKGEMFRSSLEALFSEYLINRGVKYQYEKRYKLIDGRVKVVDFTLYNHILVEVSGYAFDNWRKSFSSKMRVVRQTLNNPILILTYPENLEFIHEDFVIGFDVYFENIYDEERIFRIINYINEVKFLNDKYYEWQMANS